MSAKLVFLHGSRTGEELKLARSGVTLGRAPDSDFVFEQSDRVASRRHARIDFHRGSYVFKDLGSTTGTFINNRRVQQHELRHGDLIEFGLGGPAARFVLVQDAVEAATLPTAPKLPRPDPAEHRRARWAVAALTIRRSMRRHWRLAVVGVVVLALLSGAWWQSGQRSAANSAGFQALRTELTQERQSRERLVSELELLRGEYDTLRTGYDTLEQRYSMLEEGQSSRVRLLDVLRQPTRPTASAAPAAMLDPAAASSGPPDTEVSEPEVTPDADAVLGQPAPAEPSLAALELLGYDLDRTRKAIGVRARLMADGGARPWCAVARFSELNGRPLSDENGAFALDGEVASRHEFVPAGGLQEIELFLPLDELHLDRRAERAGLLLAWHALEADLRVWPAPCSARSRPEPALGAAGPLDVCLIRYLLGWGECDG